MIEAMAAPGRLWVYRKSIEICPLNFNRSGALLDQSGESAADLRRAGHISKWHDTGRARCIDE